jgi:hypothetical protein
MIPGMPDSLGALVDQDLQEVVFVMDYLQLGFSSARFTAYIWPTVTISDVCHEFGDPGYRDALCSLITTGVVEAAESPVAGLVIRFGEGDVVIDPGLRGLAGPEIATLQVHEDAFRDASWAVWRPGEGVFAGRGEL